MNKELFDKCVEVASKAISGKGHALDPRSQVQNIFSYATADKTFETITNCQVTERPAQELLEQIKYICEIGIDTAKGRKLVYVKTRNLNIGTREKKAWITMPDIQESYHALIQILIRSDLVKHITVIHTYENYPIEYSGKIGEIPIVKSWQTSPSERGAYTGCFVIIFFPDGTVMTSYHHLSDILDTHKKFSKSGGTWEDHKQAMVAKSAILDATRYIPKLDTIVSRVVEHYDNSMDYGEYVTEEQAMQIETGVADSGINVDDFLSFLRVSRFCDIPADKYKIAMSTIKEKASHA